jgi:hypothetical protein
MHSTRMTNDGRRGRGGAASSGVGRSWLGRVLVGAGAMVLLTGCSVLSGSQGSVTVSGTAGPVGIVPAGPAKDETSKADPPKDTKTDDSKPGGTKTSTKEPATPVKGCPKGGTQIPTGAGQARTPDLDGDGKADTVWVMDLDGSRTLGVRTASGAGFTRTFTSGAPTRASAIGGRLGDGTAVILLDFSRNVQLYAVYDCQIVVTRNAQNAQYSFDEGYTGYGTGVGCPEIGKAGHVLAGYLATATGSTYTVTRTTIDLSRGGAVAANGVTKTLGNGLAAGSAIVRTAMDVSCGSSASAEEPVS